MSANKALQQLVMAIHPLTPEALDAFCTCFTPFSAKRKEIITAADTKERFLYFVTGGAQRIYYMDDTGREATLLFTYPYSFGGVLDSFMLQQPSRYVYESLSPATFLRATYTELNSVRQQYPNVEVMINKGIAAALSGILERLAEIQLFSAEEKLRALFKRSPHIFQLIPQKYLASYLGMDATNLSKFMNGIKL